MKSFKEFDDRFGPAFKGMGFIGPEVKYFSNPKGWQAEYRLRAVKVIADTDPSGIVALYVVSTPEPPIAFPLSTLCTLVTGRDYSYRLTEEEEIEFLEDNFTSVERMIDVDNRLNTQKRIENFVDGYHQKKFPDAFRNGKR